MEEHVEFKNRKIYIYLYEKDYECVKKLAKNKFHKSTAQLNCIRTYLIVKMFSILNPYSKYVPINTDIFESIVNTGYKDYLKLLSDKKNKNVNGVIHTKKNLLNFDGVIRNIGSVLCCIKKSDTNNENKTLICKVLELNEHIYELLFQKYQFINEIISEYKSDKKRAQKINEVLKLSFNEIEFCNVITNFLKSLGKVKTQKSIERKINILESKLESSKLCNVNFFSIKDKLCSIIYNLNLTNQSTNQPITHNLNGKIGAQVITNQNLNSNLLTFFNTFLSYYSDLRVDISALKFCIFVKYFSLISRVNMIPEYHENTNKLYSTFANMPKILRKYVRYKGEKLVEVSDIRCAHFTLLPKTFEKCGIKISDEEMTRFKDLVQNKDLYSEVIKSSPMSREDIKEVFESFLSIKNERQYCYNENKDYNKRTLVCNYFKTNFPEIYNALLTFHNKYSFTINSVANAVESEIMNFICDKLRAENLHPFRVHDAIYLPESETPSFNIKDRVFEYINK